MPTPGLIMESIVGDCDGCEDFIRDGRALELRRDEASARQQEAEATRFERRQSANPPDLDDPVQRPSPEIRVRLEQTAPVTPQ